jgi:polyisoprenoid-binding protein YceI
MQPKKILKALAIALVAALPAVALAQQAKRFDVHATGGSRIIFESDAPLETITGVTSSVSGSVQVDPANLAQARGRIEVPIASLRTGVDLRDEHLRSDNWLDAQRHPNAVFEITGVTGARSLAPNETARVQVRGRFTLHGVTHDLTAPAQIQYRPGANGEAGIILVRTRFSVSLPSYGVSVPTIVRLKVSDEITVRVSLRLHESSAAPRASNP